MMLGVMMGASALFSGGSILQLGFLAASMALTLTQKGKDQNKLNDLRVSCSTYGRGIQILYGTMRLSGNMVWATDLVEHRHYYDMSGKNKDKKHKSKDKWNTVYEYTANFAMGLCEGPVEEVIRIWADSALIFDRFATGVYDPNNDRGTPYDPTDPATQDIIVTPGFSHHDGASKKGRKGNHVDGTFGFRFYTGSEEQGQDPFMVSKQGADKVPAFRGLCYLMFENFALTDFGNRIPTITAEVTWKRRPAIMFGTMENLPTPPNHALDDRVFLDLQRQRLYQVAAGAVGGSALRVFDLGSSREIKRVLMSDIGVDTIQGVSGSGFLVGTLGGGNATPIKIIDGNTFTVINTVGQGGNDLYLSTESVQTPHASMAVPGNAMDSLGNNFLTCIILTQFLDVITLDQDGNFAGGTHTGLGNIFHANGSIAPGAPLPEGSMVYIAVPSTVSPGPAIWQTVANAKVGVSDGLTMEQILSAEGIDLNSFIQKIYQYDWLDGVDVGAGHSTPFPVYGGECVGLIETVVSNDPDRAGVWAVKLAPATQNDLNQIHGLDTNDTFASQRLLWRARISADPTDGPNSFIYQPPILGNDYCWIRNTSVFQVDFRAQTMDSWSIPANGPTYVAGQAWDSTERAVICIVNDNGEQKWAYAYVDRMGQAPASLQDIVLDVGERVGIDEIRIDVSKLNNVDVKGFMIENPTSARGIIEDLSKVFLFDVCESDYTLKYISRGQASMVTIPQDHLGIVSADEGEAVNGADDYYKETRMQEIDLPMRVNVSYADPGNKYQVSSAHFKRPNSPFPVLQTKQTVDLNLPMALTADQAKQMAYKCLYSSWAERTTHEFILPWTYAMYDATDVATFAMDDGLAFTDRIAAITMGADFSLEVKGVTQFAGTYTSTVKQAKKGGTIAVPHPKMPGTRPIVLDIPYLDDSQVQGTGASGYTLYWGVGAYGEGFDYASVGETTGTASERGIGFTLQEAIWGYVIGPIPAPAYGPYCTDTVNKLTLIPAHSFDSLGVVWQSVPDTTWPSHKNTIVVGGEIIHFKNAVENDDGSVTIDTMIRGARGTEFASTHHSDKSELFVMFNDFGTMYEEQEPIASLGQKSIFRSYSASLMPIPLTQSVTQTGASAKPYAPDSFTRTEAGGNVTIAWQRRTRFDGALVDGNGTVPLNEDSELYEVYLLHAPFDPTTFKPTDATTYMRAFTGLTVPSLTYTAAMMATDGKLITDTIYLVAFQISAKVGRGFPGSTKLEHRFYPNS